MRRLEGRRQPGRPRHRWEESENGFSRCGMRGRDEIDLAQERDRWWSVVIAVTKIRFSEKAVNFLTSWDPVSF